VIIRIVNPRRRRYGEILWNHIISPEVKAKAPRAPVAGHGL